jgi:hypothetical protein
MLFWPVTPAVFHENPLPIIGTQFKPGDELPIHFKLTRYVKGSPAAYRKIINDVVINLPPMLGRVHDIGTFDFVSNSTVLPKYLHPGRYYIEFCFVYKVNPLREEIVRVNTQHFWVVK